MFSDKYQFHVERFRPVYQQIKPMLKANHEETGVYDLPFNPDWARYLALDDRGDLRCFSARLEGEIVAFAIFFIDTEIQQMELKAATQSVNYVLKEHRGIGLGFMRFCDDILIKQGVNSIWRQSTAKLDISKIYGRMGYSFAEQSYVRSFRG